VVDTHAHAPAEVVRIIAKAMAERPGRAIAELAKRLDAGEAPFS
jgi:hypothetical protein